MDIEYEDIVAKDIEFHIRILNYCYENKWIKSNMDKIVSKYPWQDICLLVWIAGLVGLFEIRSHFFWMTSINFVISFGE